ncbi:esterase [Serratia microhaemolytica]|uniref:esterase n=1 Tax=Serratia microhaemolytica TaxID=2675110 RepID=UPI000FDD8F29|nr:esterase [Serratia microhaemolytica]
MQHDSLIIQRPADGAKQLFLLFHGFGDDLTSMQPIGKALASHFPHALIVSIAAPTKCENGQGGQWFSLQGINDANRLMRVTEAIPQFISKIREWQQQSGVSAAATALLGFSQGATLSLQALASEPELAGRVVALAGRFAQWADFLPTDSVIHLIHGAQDTLIPLQHVQTALTELQAQGRDITLDIADDIGHSVNQQMLDLMCQRLGSYIPQRYWQQAYQQS